MKRKKPAHPVGKSTRLAVFFGLLILLLIISSLGIKFVLLLAKSKFDGKHQFLLQVVGTSRTELVAFDPDTSSITIATLPAYTTARQVGVPTDATIAWNGADAPKELTKQILFHFPQFSSLTPVDALNLFIFSQTVADTQVSRETITLPLDTLSQQTINKMFVDKTLYQEGQTVEIVNAADTLGLGNTAASMMGRLGVNVISVTTAGQDRQTSEIDYTGGKTYTVKRLMNLFHLPAVHTSSQQVSDIVVFLGKNGVGLFQ